MTTFVRQQEVRFQHCDPAGIVFYPRYFEMINETVEEWFAAGIGVSFAEIHGPMNAAVPTAAIEIKFTAPSRLGDILEFGLRPLKLGGSSVQLEISARCGEERRLDMTTTLVFVDQSSGKPQRWPDNIRSIIETAINSQENQYA